MASQPVTFAIFTIVNIGKWRFGPNSVWSDTVLRAIFVLNPVQLDYLPKSLSSDHLLSWLSGRTTPSMSGDRPWSSRNLLKSHFLWLPRALFGSKWGQKGTFWAFITDIIATAKNGPKMTPKMAKKGPFRVHPGVPPGMYKKLYRILVEISSLTGWRRPSKSMEIDP